jgi:hypothetical protein
MPKSPNRRVIGALAVAGLAVVASGTAFTASNTGMPATDTVGYGATTVSGATVNSLTYVYNTAKSTVTGVTLVLDGDTTAHTVQLAFNDAAPATCSGAGNYDSSTTETTYDCVVSQDVATLAKTALFVD